ncbi:NAD(P)-dependent oxidoreductase [Natronococcus jeotgali]|uniref:D-isomer specific 2-hydroxyacid dehydrogenase NAD-binding protein n=1 Tax=Natronococcus jeotgali DSM 18795 TaxID=1227498 RepID=L9XJA8_9EURY|nr:NAD(P)-dependent oxidoreductase [Natronococcus jeotgali]ELY61677.1 D-isomer specific 2-hydroxyacid dehydrogenase NAD-binding protein [Natronococcus jeotgali DSM 18795]
MTRTIVVGPLFEDVWPLAADHLRELWAERGPVEFRRLDETPERLVNVLDEPSEVTELAALGAPVTETDAEQLTALESAFVMTESMYAVDADAHERLEGRGVTVYDHTDEGFWAQSVAEFGLGLTIDALRKIPQKHARMIESHDPWDLDKLNNEVPGANGHQFADDPAFTNGTIAGTRIRVAGVGNIGSTYADAVASLGADVAAYDPYADEPCFHRSGADRVCSLEVLVEDAEVFVPTVPLTDATEGLITAEHIHALPEGCVVVLITRAGVVDTGAVRERVLAGEIALAADVWDEEPLPLDDSLLDRHNVIHTPHIAGRTRDANKSWSERLDAHFRATE